MKLGVVICTYNPDQIRLREVLDALRSQTMDVKHWDLIVVDNASKNGVLEDVDLSWHPTARIVQESRLGLTNARVKGIEEVLGDPIVFVDDDNVLARDYLENCFRISERCKWLGAWGGHITGRFEAPPESWHDRYLPLLALRTVGAEEWTNVRHSAPYEPVGAGLVVRRVVAERYRQKILVEPWRRGLDRTGSNLISGGDHDLVRCCSPEALGWGVFPTLRLEHLIPASRLDWSYLQRLVRGVSASNTMLALSEGVAVRPTPLSRRAVRIALLYLKGGRRSVEHYLAEQAGIHDGLRLYAHAVGAHGE